MIEQPTPQVAQATSSHLPWRIAWFERLLYLGVILSVVRFAIDQPKGVSIIALVAWHLMLVAHLALIWLAARRRKIRAAWTLLGFFLVWISFTVLQDAIGSHSLQWHPPNPVSVGLRVVQMLIEGLGLMLVFSRRGRRWFFPNSDRRRDWNGV